MGIYLLAIVCLASLIALHRQRGFLHDPVDEGAKCNCPPGSGCRGAAVAGGLSSDVATAAGGRSQVHFGERE